MKVLGLIMEANPFHNGHSLFMREAISRIDPDVVIVVTSTYFSMRGEVSLLDKKTKTQLYLDHKADIVLELPTAMTLNSAKYFACSALEILDSLKITDLAFGVETATIPYLNYLVDITTSNEYNDLLKEIQKKVFRTKETHVVALEKLGVDKDVIELTKLPNTTLALEYLKWLKQNKSKIKVTPINRQSSNYHDQVPSDQHIASATAIRSLYSKNVSVKQFIDYDEYTFRRVDTAKLFTLIKYHTQINNVDYSSIQNCHEGIENYFLSKLKQANSIEVFAESFKNKRYTLSRFNRLLFSILLEIKHGLSNYLRLLGFNENGEAFISTLPKQIKKSFVHFRNKKNNHTLIVELKASRLFDMLTDSQSYEDEYKFPIKGANNG